MYSLKRFSFDNVIPNEMSLNHEFLRLVTPRACCFTVFAPKTATIENYHANLKVTFCSSKGRFHDR